MKMKKVFLLFLIFISCETKEAEISIDKGTFISILADLHVAEEMVKKFREDDKDSVRKAFLLDISTIHKTDTSIIKSNLDIIQQHPDLAFNIYQEVYKKLDSIGKKESEKLAKPKPKEMKSIKKDSLQKQKAQ